MSVIVKAMVFPVVMHRCKSWTIKKAEHQRTMLSNCGAGGDSWESLDCKEIKPVNPKRNQPWIFIRKTDAKAEAPILWPLDSKSWLIGKDPDAGKDWRQEEKEEIKDEMVGWRHWLNGHEVEKAPGHSEGQGKPAVLQSMGRRVRQDLETKQQPI